MAKKITSQKKQLPAGTALSFRSKIVNWAEGMDYCAIPVPAAVTKKLGTSAAVLVMARVNGSEAFKVSLFPAGGGKHFIRLRKKVRSEFHLSVGDAVRVHFEVLDRDKNAGLPKDLEEALRDENMLGDFKAIPPGARNYLIRKIDDAVKSETRRKRIAEAVDAAHVRSEKTKKV